jgi:hypothetical protein
LGLTSSFSSVLRLAVTKIINRNIVNAAQIFLILQTLTHINLLPHHLKSLLVTLTDQLLCLSNYHTHFLALTGDYIPLRISRWSYIIHIMYFLNPSQKWKGENRDKWLLLHIHMY